MKIDKRPDLTEKYPAIDGIAKPERNARWTEDCMGNEVKLSEPAEDAVRGDILELLKMPLEDFSTWVSPRYFAARELRDMLELIGGIPDLGWAHKEHSFSGRTSIRNLLQDAEDAMLHCCALMERYNKLNGIKTNIQQDNSGKDTE